LAVAASAQPPISESAGVNREAGARRLDYGRMDDWLDETLSAVK
jgi:hypothetical protein